MMKNVLIMWSIFICTGIVLNISAMEDSSGFMVIQFPDEKTVLLPKKQAKQYGAFSYMNDFGQKSDVQMVESDQFSWNVQQLCDGTSITSELMQKVFENQKPSSAAEASAMFMMTDYLGGEGKEVEQKLKELARTCLKLGVLDEIDATLRHGYDAQQCEQLRIRKNCLLCHITTIEDVINSLKGSVQTDYGCRGRSCGCGQEWLVDLSNCNIEHPYGLNLLITDYPIVELNLSNNQLSRSHLFMIMDKLPYVKMVNLSHNNIKCVTAKELESLRFGVNLDLSHNFITEFPDCVLPARSHVDLRGNLLFDVAKVKNNVEFCNRWMLLGVGLTASGFSGGAYIAFNALLSPGLSRTVMNEELFLGLAFVFGSILFVYFPACFSPKVSID